MAFIKIRYYNSTTVEAQIPNLNFASATLSQDILAYLMKNQPSVTNPDQLSETNPQKLQAIRDQQDQLTQALFDAGIQYLIVKKSEHGFTIILNKPAPQDINFSWIALAVRSAKLFSSKEVGTRSDTSPSPLPPAPSSGSNSPSPPSDSSGAVSGATTDQPFSPPPSPQEPGPASIVPPTPESTPASSVSSDAPPTPPSLPSVGSTTPAPDPSPPPPPASETPTP